MVNIRKLERELWESSDLLRAESKLTSNQYCMPVLGLIFLRYAYSRYKMVEAEIMRGRPARGGRVMPVEESDFTAKSALYLPQEAQYDYLLHLPADIAGAGIRDKKGNKLASLGAAINNAMALIEEQSDQLSGVLPRSYTDFTDTILAELLRIFNNSDLGAVGGDVIGRIYEYFLNKFAKNIASDDGVFFTPKSLVKMIVNVLAPTGGVLLDPACGSGGMFIQSGESANTFYHDAHHLSGKCDYIMANPPFNVDRVKEDTCAAAGRLPFGLPGVNKKKKEVSNANYLWISYFYSYLNAHGRAGFVMASSATDSQGKDRDIREQLVRTGHVDVMVSVGNNFFYTKSLPCSLWFYDKGKTAATRDRVLLIDARSYYTVVDRTLNEWSEWQLRNLTAIVWLYRGEQEKYTALLAAYRAALGSDATFDVQVQEITAQIEELRTEAKTAVDAAPRRERKKTQAAYDARIAALTERRTTAEEAVWLYEKFGEGEYRDVLGLCKVAYTTEEVRGADADGVSIEGRGWSLTPGAYVGVAPTADDGVDFAARMAEIHQELVTLQAESNELMATISKNMREMGL